MENKSNNDDFDIKKKYVNGPINVVRMEGKIGNKNKVLYLFMDLLIPIGEQTECSNIYSMDIEKFIANNLLHSNSNSITYDFFLQITPSELLIPKESKYFETKDIYLANVFKFFQKIFSYDTMENKIKAPDSFKKVRLHYIDISAYINGYIFSVTRHIREDGMDMFKKGYVNLNFLAHIIEILKETKIRIKKMDEIFNMEIISPTGEKMVSIDSKDSDDNVVFKFVYKIKHKYHYNHVENTINRLFTEYVKEIKEIINILEHTSKIMYDFGDYVHDNKDKFTVYNYGISSINEQNKTKKYYYIGTDNFTMRKMLVEIADRCELIHNITYSIFSSIINLYFLRRFLDKDYVTNAIIYDYYKLTSDFISHLISLFHFKITHISHSNIMDMAKLEKEILRRSKNGEDCNDIFLPKEVLQCSNLTHFPSNFT